MANDAVNDLDTNPDIPYLHLADEKPDDCCNCSDVCECTKVNMKAGALCCGSLPLVGCGMVGAATMGLPLVVLDHCCFPPQENHDCAGRLCKVCGVAAAIPGVPAGAAGAIGGGVVGIVAGLLCSPIAFFGCKPKCYTDMNVRLNGIVKDICDDLRGDAPAPQSMY